MSLKSKLRRNKKKWENKLKKQQKRRDVLKKEMFGFPNLSLPLCLWTFTPSFLVLAILSRFYETLSTINVTADLWTIAGIASAFYLQKLETQWFTMYGTQKIIQKEIPWHKANILIYLMCIATIIGAGAFLKTKESFYIFLLCITCGSIWLSTHKDALIWDMPPVRILGFKKYEFTPEHEDAHIIRNKTYKCVLKKYNTINENDCVEGTYMGNGWFYLRKQK